MSAIGTNEQDVPAETARSIGPTPVLSSDQRRKMIAEAAYFRALARGLQGGDPVDDWLMAEAEIDRQLLRQTRQPDEQAIYEQLRAEVQKRLAAMRESADARALQEAIENS